MNPYYFLLITAVFGVVLASLFVLMKTTNRMSVLFLASFYVLTSINNLQIFVLESNLLSKVPWFYGWPLLFFTLIPVALFFYFISSFQQDFKWKWRYAMLFISFVIALVDVVQWYVKGSEFRHLILQEVIANPNQRFKISYGFLTLKTQILVKNTVSVISVLTLLPMLIRYLKGKSISPNQRVFNNWLLVFWSLATLKFLIWFVWSITSYFNTPAMVKFFATINQPVVMFFAFTTFLIGLVPFYFPSILYPFSSHDNKNRIRASKSNKSISIPPKVRSDVNEEDIINKIKEIELLQLYLSTEFDITELASKVNLPTHQLSYILNKHFNISFSEYRNNLRMQHAAHLILQGFLKHNTTEALSWTCGFASRSSFSKNFKKEFGSSPSNFSKNLK